MKFPEEEDKGKGDRKDANINKMQKNTEYKNEDGLQSQTKSGIGMPAITEQSTGNAHFDSSSQDSLTKSAIKKNVEESKMPDFHGEDQ